LGKGNEISCSNSPWRSTRRLIAASVWETV
jgi:hypothetical protein